MSPSLGTGPRLLLPKGMGRKENGWKTGEALSIDNRNRLQNETLQCCKTVSQTRNKEKNLLHTLASHPSSLPRQEKTAPLPYPTHTWEPGLTVESLLESPKTFNQYFYKSCLLHRALSLSLIILVVSHKATRKTGSQDVTCVCRYPSAWRNESIGNAGCCGI